jgi:polyketide biosynthesis enoyl-CoA hydratase PksH
MTYQTLRVQWNDKRCFIQIYRPDAKNAINTLMVEELYEVLTLCEDRVNIIVLEGLPEVFCFGADFAEISSAENSNASINNSEKLYEIWTKLATGPYITIAHVRGKVNAGGIGFVAASDIVLADATAEFSLSELLFGLFPACVLPFLIRRIGFQKAHYLTLMTQPVSVSKAFEWGLVDAYEEKSDSILRRHLLRLERLPKSGITEYKRYMNQLYDKLSGDKETAIEANHKMFLEPQNLDWIYQFATRGKLPWEN